MEKNKVLKDIEKFFHDDKLKFQLITASIYLSAYEILIYSIVEKIKQFYVIGYDGEKNIYSDNYNKDVKCLYKKDIVIASALWLMNQSAISEDEVNIIKALKKHRNDIAHELPKYLTDSSFNLHFSLFEKMEMLHKKICLWWFKEIEVSINPSFDLINLNNLDYEEIISTVILPMTRIIYIVRNEYSKIDID